MLFWDLGGGHGFWSLSPRALNNALQGLAERKKTNERQRWEVARWQSWVNLMPHQAKGKKLKQTDLFQFEWEKSDSELNKEKIQAMLNRIAKRDGTVASIMWHGQEIKAS